MQENTCTKHYSIAHLIDTSQMFYLHNHSLSSSVSQTAYVCISDPDPGRLERGPL